MFYELTESTKQDLAVIETKLIELGVDVVRPVYDRIEDYVLSEHHPYSPGQLDRPQICPRDHFLVYGNTHIGDEFCCFIQESIAHYQNTDFAQFMQAWQRLRRRDLDFGY